ncbi:MAG TPA: hypothetical protein VK988_06775 [Acidimicrobiales bacterium]|nr:hypothetical protein [Acidimicrobiales bacterium]
MIWLLPLLVVVMALVPVVVAAMAAAGEARSLVWEVRKLGTLRPALVEVRTAGRNLGASLRSASLRNGTRT